MNDSIDSALGAVLWLVFVLSLLTVGLSRTGNGPLSALAGEIAPIFIFSLLFIAILRVLIGE